MVRINEEIEEKIKSKKEIQANQLENIYNTQTVIVIYLSIYVPSLSISSFSKPIAIVERLRDQRLRLML